MTSRPPVKGSNSPADRLAELVGGNVGVGTPRLRRPTVAGIVKWRHELANKYRDQLEETLVWDEQTTFQVSEDLDTSSEVIFHYLAAILDQSGTSALSKLIDVTDPPIHEYDTVFAEADRRGFSGRFPQLLLGASSWLPFKRHLIIEEPDWDGKVTRYGSVFHLLDEINAVRAAIAIVNPSITNGAVHEASNKAVFGAWQSSNVLLRLAEIATAKRLPLWTTG